MSLQAILNKPHFRRTFFFAVAVSMVLLVVLRQFVFPELFAAEGRGWADFAYSFLDGLLTSVLVSLFIGGALFLLTPKIMEFSQVRILEPPEIGVALRSAIASTESWSFCGNSGRYFRAKPLQELARQARAQSQVRSLAALFLNPANRQVCSYYAQYRDGLHSAGEGKPWTTSRVQAECLATLLCILHVRKNESQVKFEIGLRESFSTFRVDINPNSAIVTREDKRVPALLYEKASIFYSAYKDEVFWLLEQTGVLSLGAGLELSSASRGTVREQIGAMGLRDAEIDDEVIDVAIKLARSPADPYE